MMNFLHQRKRKPPPKNSDKNALSHEFLPTAKGVIIWIFYTPTSRLKIIRLPTNHQTTRLIALIWLLLICYQKTSWNAADPHKYWILSTSQLIQTRKGWCVRYCFSFTFYTYLYCKYMYLFLFHIVLNAFSTIPVPVRFSIIAYGSVGFQADNYYLQNHLRLACISMSRL